MSRSGAELVYNAATTPELTVQGNASGITTDQRGLPRPGVVGCDIGAVEVQATLPPSGPVLITQTFTG